MITARRPVTVDGRGGDPCGRRHTVIERGGVTVAVPRHRALRTGTLRAILEEIDMGVNELAALMGKGN